MSKAPPLEVRGLSEMFTGQRALIDIDLEVQPGEIRALVGQNGCGKSTLIKVLAGYHEPDDGAKVYVDGTPLALGTPGAGDHAGLRFVHPDLGLVATLDTCDNLGLGHGHEPNKLGLISWRGKRRLTHETLRDLGYDFDVRQPTRQLVISQRTAIALARALSRRSTPPRVLVLDEPTANLPAAEISRLFEMIRSVRERGVVVLFVSHHLDQVFGLCDTVTVLRDGRHVVTRPVGGLDEDGLIGLMIGRSLEEFLNPAEGAGREGEPVLRARDLVTDVLHGWTSMSARGRSSASRAPPARGARSWPWPCSEASRGRNGRRRGQGDRLQLAGAPAYIDDLFNGAALIIVVALAARTARKV